MMDAASSGDQISLTEQSIVLKRFPWATRGGGHRRHPRTLGECISYASADYVAGVVAEHALAALEESHVLWYDSSRQFHHWPRAREFGLDRAPDWRYPCGVAAWRVEGWIVLVAPCSGCGHQTPEDEEMLDHIPVRSRPAKNPRPVTSATPATPRRLDAAWIPIEDAVPDDTVDVLAWTVTSAHGRALVLNRYEDKWWPGGRVDVVAWMPLPAPPRMTAKPGGSRDD